jgi:hypothetical protein
LQLLRLIFNFVLLLWNCNFVDSQEINFR